MPHGGRSCHLFYDVVPSFIKKPTPERAVILGGVLCSNTVANLTAGLSLTVSLGFSLANCAESMTAAWLLVRFLGTPLTMTTLRDSWA